MVGDYHMHLETDQDRPPCPYEAWRIMEYVDRAERCGIPEIGVSEHSFRFAAFSDSMASLVADEVPQDPAVRRWLGAEFREDLGRYADAVLQARAGGMPVRLGIEVDYVPGAEEPIARALAAIPWDYVIGSVHFVGGRCIDCDPSIGWPAMDVDEVWARYYETMAMAARSRLFDVISHPDLPKKFGMRPRQFPQEAFDTFLREARESGTAVEVNTAGLRKPAREVYPAVALLRRMVEAGLDVHMGSDAHEPGEVGAGFGEGLALLRQVGACRVVRWRGRRREYQEIP